jgi:hypothetical protein
MSITLRQSSIGYSSLLINGPPIPAMLAAMSRAPNVSTA